MGISAVIIAKNEEKKIAECVKSLLWADEILVIDNISSDTTIEISKKLGAKVYSNVHGSYKELRNFGLKEAKYDWVLYVDADERVSKELKDEIEKGANKLYKSMYVVPRQNIILGKEMKHGGWWPDYVKRLFKKSDLKGWSGEVHEEPVYNGDFGYLVNPLIHIKHDNLADMVEKSNIWSEKEANLLFEAKHPKMAIWRFIRIMLTELYYRLFKLKGFKDGPEGVIYAFYQTWYRFLVYAKLWELQIKYARGNI